jgi:antitoxin component YwqK of YwqJK toxin-antitoxin module
MIAFRKATKGMLCDDIYVHMWNLIRKEFEDYEKIPPTGAENERKWWRKNDKLHRDFDLPSSESKGFRRWSQNGKEHREYDLPALMFFNHRGELEHAIWYKHGIIHRDGDEPADINRGLSYWYKDGNIHRDGDKPAIVSNDGSMWWIKNNKLFREDGKPTIIKGDGTQIWSNSECSWWSSNIEYYPWFKAFRIFQIDPDGTKRWFIKNKPGREGDEPAVIYPNGTQIWYKKCEIELEDSITFRTVIHRDGGKPAIICKDGSKSWFEKGKRIAYFKHGKMHGTPPTL